MATIEIDSHSGFCFGVTRAINKAEEELAKGLHIIERSLKTVLQSATPARSAA